MGENVKKYEIKIGVKHVNEKQGSWLAMEVKVVYNERLWKI